jgi:hypothetical protein
MVYCSLMKSRVVEWVYDKGSLIAPGVGGSRNYLWMIEKINSAFCDICLDL